MIKLKIAATVATVVTLLGAASAANAADCAISDGAGRTGTLLAGDFVWFSADGPKKAGNAHAGITKTYREFTDAGWAGKTITVEPKGTRASYQMAGPHGWVDEGKKSTLPAGALGVGCYPVKK